ncbi:MAG TPA: YggT family protein [Burkholderiales bacterium]|nr:YggT family protein [Pseudomonadota bacterium]HVC48863.1 YggT family protein [Burkholderiales bacterium]
MLNQAANFLVQTFCNLLILAFMLRFYMNLTSTSFRHPFAHFITSITDFAVRPLRQTLPGFRKIDLASFLPAFFTSIILECISALLNGISGSNLARAWKGILLLAFVNLLQALIHILMGVVIIQAVLSWIAPYNPVQPMLDSLSWPVMRYARRILPPLGGVDLSPLLVLILCQLILVVPLSGLIGYAYRLMY